MADVWNHYGATAARTHGKPGKDVQQLGGAALFSPESKLLWCYRQRDSGDVISGDELIIQLTAAIEGSRSN